MGSSGKKSTGGLMNIAHQNLMRNYNSSIHNLSYKQKAVYLNILAIETRSEYEKKELKITS